MADDEVEVLACTSLILAGVGAAIAISDGRKRKRKHKTWVNAYIHNRSKFGTFNTLLPELCAGGKYFRYLRMDVAIFEELYALVEPEIARKETRMR